MSTFAPVSRIPLLSSLPVLLALAACGGGGGGTPASTDLTLSGTAATGAAVASAPVAAKCASGTGTATSGADGGFAMTVSGGALPCVLRVTAADGTVLHSVASGSGSSARANISPLTDLAVAHLAGTEPSALWDNFEPARVSSEAVASAAAVVLAVVESVGGDASAVGNPFTASLAPPNGSNPGNAYDQALESLKTALDNAGLTLQELRDQVVAGSPSSPGSGTSTATSLPPELLLAPKAANCPTLASGRYRILGFGNGDFADTATLDATNLTLRQVFDDGSDPETTQLTAGTQPCEFTDNVGSQIVVGAAGVALISFVADDGVSRRMALMFPEQSYALADLQGEWLLMETETGGGVHTGHRGEQTMDTNGTLTAATYCENFGPCSVDDAQNLSEIRIAARTDGGFDSVDIGASESSRVFGFRSGGGQLHLIGITAGGGWQFLTRPRSLPLPAQGDVTQGWNLDVNGAAQVAGSLTNYRNTVTSVNPGATPPTFTRNSVFDFNTLATVSQTLVRNADRNGRADGFQRRLPATGVTASDGSTRNVSEWIGMPLVGTDLTPLWFPGNSSFSMSLNKPVVQ